MDELLAQFLIEARELVPEATAALESLRRDPGERPQIDRAFRAVHTLKGSVALFDMDPAGRTLHAAEDLLESARAGRLPLDAARVSALLACIDRLDGWIDAMEAGGRLPPEATAEAGRLIRRLEGEAAASEVAPGSTQHVPVWARALAEQQPSALLDTADELVAFRYAPDADCYFRGDDPLALVATIPRPLALTIGPREPWPEVEALDPFHCNLLIEGLSAAPLSEVQAVLRMVGEQAEVSVVPRQKRDADVATDAVRTFRIDERRIDQLVDTVGELIVAGNSLHAIVQDAGQRDLALAQRLRSFQADLERSIGAIQRSVTAMRLIPVGPAVRRLPRLVREIADGLGREVDFTITGETTEIDKAVADTLFEPLLHLVRNALDHGIETAPRRAAAGKPARGSLRLDFARSGEQLHVTLSDDGAGIDPQRVRAIAVARGIMTPEAAALLDDRGALDLIFAPGFSTAEQVTDLSGRGVGMDAVRRSVEGAGGRIQVDSRPGLGTTMSLVLPLSAITTRLLLVSAAAQSYAIPFDRIAETAVVPIDRIVAIGGGEALVLRDSTLPLLHLSELVGGARTTADHLRLVVTQIGTERVALAIDSFGERIDAMVRPASGLLATLPGIAGTTLMGSGDVLIVLDPERLIG